VDPGTAEEGIAVDGIAEDQIAEDQVPKGLVADVHPPKRRADRLALLMNLLCFAVAAGASALDSTIQLKPSQGEAVLGPQGWKRSFENVDEGGNAWIGLRRESGRYGVSGGSGGPIQWRTGYAEEVVYSVGPNGVDENGEGDDQTIDLEAAKSPVVARLSYLWGPGFLCLWLWAGIGSDLPRSRSYLRELPRTVPVFIGFVVFGWTATLLVTDRPKELLDLARAGARRSNLAIDPWLAAIGTYLVACAIGALAWRATRPKEARPIAALDLPGGSGESSS
tara:strand:+ start:239 stop:1075 length:837 start_codon:yes stop_codon:yes gene_type:complete